MKTKGKFTLLDPGEFELWFKQQTVTRKIRKVQQHHTYIPDYSNFKENNHFELLESMRDYHVTERGFSDIAQHFTTFPDGTIGTGRSLNTSPACIKGANTEAICIENLGNFDKGANQMTSIQRDSIIKITAILLERFGIKADTNGIIYHHWFDLDTGKRTNGTGNTKTCPGTNFFGGNSVQDCQEHFIPLVQSEIESATIDRPPEGARVLKTGIVKAHRLNVRSGPSSTRHEVVYVLNRGAEVNCYELKGKWWRIHPTKDRWIYSKYVDQI